MTAQSANLDIKIPEKAIGVQSSWSNSRNVLSKDSKDLLREAFAAEESEKEAKISEIIALANSKNGQGSGYLLSRAGYLEYYRGNKNKAVEIW